MTIYVNQVVQRSITVDIHFIKIFIEVNTDNWPGFKLSLDELLFVFMFNRKQR
jgi:hypothetical protein